MANDTVLILTNSEDVTADYLESCLKKSRIRVVRYNTDSDLMSTNFTWSLHDQVVSWQSQPLRPDEIAAIVFRRPKPFTPLLDGDHFHIAHAADEWAEVWEGFLAQVPDSKWINHPSRNFGASHKTDQLTKAVKCGFRVPESLVTTDPQEALGFFDSHINGVVVKPLASGFIERTDPQDDTIIYTRKLKQRDLVMLHEIRSCPVLFQEQIRKYIDVRVTILDGVMVAIGLRKPEEDGSQRLDIRRNNMKGVAYLPIEVPVPIQNSICNIMREYQLRFAAIDFAIDEEKTWVFFEINPNGQWAWFDLEGVANIANIFIRTLRKEVNLSSHE